MIKYIEGKEENGVEIDWKFIKKEYEKLRVPDDVYLIPWDAIFNGNKYIIALSERSTGKTTCYLLIGLLLFKHYGIVTQYIRQENDQLSPSHAIKLVKVIKEFDNGRYIEQLTDGKYNDIKYHWKAFYYCKRDEKGDIVETCENEIIHCLSIDKNFDYKSTYNAPFGDWIIFDEFIGKTQKANECVDFLDLLSTIIRLRLSPTVIMIANNINRNSQYFEDLEISKEIQNLKIDESKEITTPKGTKMYIEIVNTRKDRAKKSKHNALFFGFNNPKLVSITGGGTWSFESVPHIPTRDSTWRCIENRVYLELNMELLQLEFVEDENRGQCLEIHRATKTYTDSIILTLKTPLKSKNHVFGLGYGKLNKYITKMILHKKLYFSSNEVGSIFKEYIKRFQVEKNRI